MARIRRLIAQAAAARVGADAAALAFSFLFSLVPLLLFLAALTGALHLPGPAHLLSGGGAAVPAPVRRVLEQSLGRLARRPDAAALSVGVVGYLWGMSGAVRQALAAVRRAYDGPLGPAAPWWWAYAWSLALSVSLGAVLVGEVALTLIGRGALAWLAARAGLSVPVALLDGMRWTGVCAVFVVVVALLYRLAPERPGAVWPGSLAALALWLAASVALNLYAPRLMATSLVYGALGGVIVLLLYLYVLGVAIVLGAHVNAAWRPPADEGGPGR